MTDTANVELLTASRSGSVGSVTHGRNQHGPWTRPRVTPADPSTVFQQAVRTAMSQCVTAWNATLTQSERAAWERYALALRQPSTIGRQNNVGGLGMYVRSNVPRLQAAEVSLPRVDVAPSLFDLAPFTLPPRVVLNVVDQTLHPFFDLADDWPTEPGAAMLLWASPAQAGNVTFYKGPYRYAGSILGRVFPPERTPGTIPLPFPAGQAETVFIRGRVTRNDARLSSSFRLPANIVPQIPPAPLVAHAAFGPPWVITVTFDALLQAALLNVPNWSAVLLGRLFVVASASVSPDRTGVLLAGTLGAPAPGAPSVTFAPPPNDAVGLLTGLPVVPFANFPIT